jgi:UDP-N-acetylglucosamine transferase subunit ALG13
MGTVLTALEFHKPLLVFPRLARLGETRTDHQAATARYFAERGKLLAAFERADLFSALDRLLEFRPANAISPHASQQLLTRLRGFLLEE